MQSNWHESVAAAQSSRNSMRSFWQVSMKSWQAKVLDLVQGKPIQEPGLCCEVIFIFFLVIMYPFMCLPQWHILSPICFSKTSSYLCLLQQNITWLNWVSKETRNFHFRDQWLSFKSPESHEEKKQPILLQHHCPWENVIQQLWGAPTVKFQHWRR